MAKKKKFAKIQEAVQVEQPVKKKFAVSRKKSLIAVAALVSLTLFGFGSYKAYGFYHEYQQTKSLLNNPSTASSEEVKNILEKVGKLIELPSEETPTIATVSDITKLAGQPFFSRAMNGDKVIIYTNSKKAILYRPSTNKLVEVGPVNIPDSNAAQASVSGETISVIPTSTQPAKIVLLNGTTTTGLTKTAEKMIKEKIKNSEVTDRDNASKSDYAETLVVALSNDKQQTAQEIANTLGGKVAELPANEKKPNADIVVILGANYK